MKIKSSSPETTQKIASLFASVLLNSKSRRKNALVIGLEGELGAGKTTFIQGLARGLGIKRRLASPTFLIMKRFKNFYHIDAYRIKGPKELLVLGFKNILEDPKNIVVIEWAEKIKGALPKNAIWINLSHGRKENERIIKTN